MNEQLNNVCEFQSIFDKVGDTVFDKVGDTVNALDFETAKSRVRFCREELVEYLDAVSDKDLVGIIDSLVDLIYFAYGTVILHGMKDVFDGAFKIVHESNMSKLDDSGSPIYREDGKVLKGNNFVAPEKELKVLLDNYVR